MFKLIKIDKTPEEITEIEKSKLIYLAKKGVFSNANSLYNNIYATYNKKYTSTYYDIVGSKYTYNIVHYQKGGVGLLTDCQDISELRIIFELIRTTLNPNSINTYGVTEVTGYFKCRKNKYDNIWVSNVNTMLEKWNIK